ncbi:hypothetical protein C9E89_022280 [Acinetobacter sichuanensis]|uniref:Uncharacterized protein n=1 Tax=Acinetobacter sichuanensis TaxID=2136183 RepID=A0A371YIR1_9GAMM|nr:hypothetical protein C9E89_022280 [Acinetobacter sichuanensis]
MKRFIIKYNGVNQLDKQENIPNNWFQDPQFPTGGFKYQTSTNGTNYSIHGHGINPNAVTKFLGSNLATGATASITTRPTGGYSTQTNTLANGTKVNSKTMNSTERNQSHIPLSGSPF